MKANDLRIGNYIEKSLKSGQGRKLIDKIGCQDIVRIFENIGSFNYEPIKLTDKWLTDFGFTKTEWDNNNSFRKMVGNNDYTIVFYSNCVCEIGDIITKEIEFVHQLQNLYYALTGVELSVS
jgi:hypothetical protein